MPDRFQSSRPGWGVTDLERVMRCIRPISILTPRVGRDINEREIVAVCKISILTPRVGRDRRTFP